MGCSDGSFPVSDLYVWQYFEQHLWMQTENSCNIIVFKIHAVISKLIIYLDRIWILNYVMVNEDLFA